MQTLEEVFLLLCQRQEVQKSHTMSVTIVSCVLIKSSSLTCDTAEQDRTQVYSYIHRHLHTLYGMHWTSIYTAVP